MKNKIFKEVVITEDMLSSTDTTIGELLDKAVFEARIEEMAKVIRPILEERVDIGFIPDLDKPIAEELIKQDYRKIPKGAVVLKQKLLKEMYEQGKFDAFADLVKDGKVVLSKEEYEGLKIAKDFDYGYHEGERNMTSYYENIRLPEMRKETAEKFARDIFNNITTPEVWNELRTLWLNIGGGKKSNLPIWNLLIEPVAKQFGVEVEE